jgi:hypothetical protein
MGQDNTPVSVYISYADSLRLDQTNSPIYIGFAGFETKFQQFSILSSQFSKKIAAIISLKLENCNLKIAADHREVA